MRIDLEFLFYFSWFCFGGFVILFSSFFGCVHAYNDELYEDQLMSLIFVWASLVPYVGLSRLSWWFLGSVVALLFDPSTCFWPVVGQYFLLIGLNFPLMFLLAQFWICIKIVFGYVLLVECVFTGLALIQLVLFSWIFDSFKLYVWRVTFQLAANSPNHHDHRRWTF